MSAEKLYYLYTSWCFSLLLIIVSSPRHAQGRSLLQRFGGGGNSFDNNNYDDNYDNNNDQQNNGVGGYGGGGGMNNLQDGPPDGLTGQTQAQLWLRFVFDTMTDLVLRGLYENFPTKWTKRKLIRIKNMLVRKAKPLLRRIFRIVGRRLRLGFRSLKDRVSFF